jgi:hypothetical protein
MALSGTQICSWDDIASEVAAGRMVWNGAAQSGTNDVTWAQFIAHVNYDGTNPSGFAATQCVNYNGFVARVTTIQVPTGVAVATAGPHNVTGSWGAPGGGLAPTSYNYQFFQNGVAYGAVVNTAALTAPSPGGFTTGASVTISVQGKNGSNVGPWSTSFPVTVL